jgi:flagellar biosynthesis protein FlhG
MSSSGVATGIDVGQQNHYEVLEVGRGARSEEIERAYRMATATWSEGSLALYSLFDDEEASLVRERIVDAYHTLSDEEARSAYDLEVFGEPVEPEPEALAEAGEAEAGAPEPEAFDDLAAALDSTLEDGVDQQDTYGGPQLRRMRMQRGIEIPDIAEITKVSGRYLTSIEEEDFQELPAAVYVRGFVTAYALAIGLDPQKVAASYMPRFDEARQGKSRGRLLGRR